jgi:hypothetical protein
MKKLSNLAAVAVSFLFLFWGCQKDEQTRPHPNPDYPTVYNPIPASEWEVRNAEFQLVKIHEGLSLNKYGFVEGTFPLIGTDTLTEEFIIDMVKSLFDNYSHFLGLPEDVDINYKEQLRINTPYMVPSGSDNIESFFRLWEEYADTEAWKQDLEKIDFNFFISQLFIEKRRFLGPEIHVHFKLDEKLIELSNNWYPGAYVPSSEIYSFDDAVSIAYREILKQTGDDIWHVKHDFPEVKIFTMVNTANGVEIRECWRLSLINKDFYYVLFVDTQSGEVIRFRKSNVNV